MGWLRRSFLTGLVVTVPLLITVVTLWWMFRFVDGFARPLSMYMLGREVPGLGVLITAAFILVIGAVGATPWPAAFARRVLERAHQEPATPVRQTAAAFTFATLALLFVVSAVLIAANTYSPFIYFRF